MEIATRELYDQRHGGPFDRGSADSWYGRAFDPHYYVEGTATSTRVGLAEMTAEEITAYSAGYSWNEKFGGKKEY
jgi:hypothetical protein